MKTGEAEDNKSHLSFTKHFEIVR